MSAAEQYMSKTGLEVGNLLVEDAFESRHIGPRQSDIAQMLKQLGVKSLEQLIEKTIPSHIRLEQPLAEVAPLSERALLDYFKGVASKNQVFRSFIGQGYYRSVTPPVIQRNILENPGWYTQYTPYQAEIAQGRLEVLATFQTMVSDLTAMDLANASLLDEATAAAEAMTVCARAKSDETRNKFFVADDCHPQTIDVMKTRALPLGIEIVLGDPEEFQADASFFGVLLQYPNTFGEAVDYRTLAEQVHAAGALLVVASDLLALTQLTPPGEWGADIVVGNSQRFGVPLGFGGPHAAFFACKDEFKRDIPGRIIGLSKDANGKPAYRLALQTREQHIRRDKATSNICTAQVLLAIMAGLYAMYHGEQGLKRIATRVHGLTRLLKKVLEAQGVTVYSNSFFDTLLVEVEDDSAVAKRAEELKLNFRSFENPQLIGVSLDELTTLQDIRDIVFAVTGNSSGEAALTQQLESLEEVITGNLQRTSSFLQHPIFTKYHSETEFLRYMRRQEAKDLSLTTSMIPLGSCTMKLNASAEMLPITWPEFAQIHPFAPATQTLGWKQVIDELEAYLATVTGFAGASVQPNAGSQGEYAGLLVIQAWHQSRNEAHRDICLIPTSAHGTNPASAVMAGMKVVTVQCDESGNIDVADLRSKAQKYATQLSCLMVTYPSTHGVFETAITEVCKIIHDCGGQVYMDGANLNAQVGLTSPSRIGADVCHINLHKTFCIPHGGGGPGVGPIAVAKHLVPFLPGHVSSALSGGVVGGEKAIGAVSAAPWGSALILLISLAYIRMMGSNGITNATSVAILNANYIANRLAPHFPILYQGENGFVAHECILDLRNLKRSIGIEAQDVAKRLMDYGFHAPTVSFPVVETLMVEPTESESLEELDRFCDAMIAIRQEIKEIEDGKVAVAESALKQAPHTAADVTADTWDRPYTRQQAAYPAPWLATHKYWPPVRRIDNVYGDRNLFCACAPVATLEE